MNLSQMIKEVNKDIDDSLDNEDVIGWINRGLDELSLITRKEAKQTFDLSSSTTFPLPSDLLEIAFVLADNSECYRVDIKDKSSRGYKVWGNEVSLQNLPDMGDLELYYFKRLAHLENDEDAPDIEPDFHDLLVLYAVAHSQYADEEPERQRDALNRYFTRKAEYEAYILRNSNTDYQVIISNPVY